MFTMFNRYGNTRAICTAASLDERVCAATASDDTPRDASASHAPDLRVSRSIARRVAVGLGLSVSVLASGAAASTGGMPSTLSPRAEPPLSARLAPREKGAQFVIRGYVREKSGADEYVIVDDTGSLRVRISPALLTAGEILLPGTHVVVRGEVQSLPGLGWHLEARQLALLGAAQGAIGTENVEIR